MNLSKIIFLIVNIISIASIVGGAEKANSEQLDTEPYALIYNGPVSDRDSTQAIANVVKQVNLPVRYVSAVKEVPALLINAKIFIIGGTSDDVEPLLYEFTPEITSALKTYLNNGGRYLGICGGAFLASVGWHDEDRYVKALGVIPAEVDSYDDSFSARILTIIWLGKERQMYYQAGPQFTLINSSESVKVIANYRSTNIAALMSSFGKGKAAVSGPHPEAPESWKNNARYGAKMESNVHLAVELLRDLLSELPLDNAN